MRRSRRVIATLRSATVVAAGAFAVHEAAYLTGYGSEVSHHAHAYLAGLLPALAVLVALTLVATVEAGLAGPHATHRCRSALGIVLGYAAAILALFAAQETAEALLAAGDLSGIAALAAPGGLVALPLALAFGSLAWLAVRGLEAVEDRLAARLAAPARRARRSTPRPRRAPAFALPVLAACAAARAPPAV